MNETVFSKVTNYSYETIAPNALDSSFEIVSSNENCTIEKWDKFPN